MFRKLLSNSTRLISNRLYGSQTQKVFTKKETELFNKQVQAIKNQLLENEIRMSKLNKNSDEYKKLEEEIRLKKKELRKKEDDRDHQRDKRFITMIVADGAIDAVGNAYDLYEYYKDSRKTTKDDNQVTKSNDNSDDNLHEKEETHVQEDVINDNSESNDDDYRDFTP